MSDTTPNHPNPGRGWPAGQWPTAEQLLDWLRVPLVGDDADRLRARRLRYVEAVIDSAQRGVTCQHNDHPTRIRLRDEVIAEQQLDLEAAHKALTHSLGRVLRLRSAWLSARRRAKA
jgi:hypothetical protein